MKFNWFTSKVVTSVAALALTSVCMDAATAKGHHNDKRFKVIAVSALDNTKTTDLFLLNGQDGKQFLYLAAADGKLSIFDVTHPSAIRGLSSSTLASSDAQTFRVRLIDNRFAVASDSETDDKQALLALSDAALKEIAPKRALSDAALKEIARQFKDVEAYAVDDNKQVLYVAQPGELTVVRLDHPISRDAELFEESYEAR